MTNGNNLPSGLPPIKRCRDYHLYDYKGNRYLDLYLDGGRALMGHKPGKTMLPLKNSLEKGIWAAYPSIYSARLEKQLGKLFPKHPFIAIFANEERARAALGTSYDTFSLWIPFIPREDRLIVKPMLPGLDQTVIILSTEELPPGDTISPVLLEGIIRNFHDFTLFKERKDFSLWESFDKYKDWERKGPCLSYIGKGDYQEIVQAALEQKVLIPARPELPLYLPVELSAYELKALDKLFSSK
ncbi:MAG: hypothetical protein PQJ59_11940 [Spirochaetales bacterium]|nr:hypothetical protein [Spirochaetales bacterium]